MPTVLVRIDNVVTITFAHGVRACGDARVMHTFPAADVDQPMVPWALDVVSPTPTGAERDLIVRALVLDGKNPIIFNVHEHGRLADGNGSPPTRIQVINPTQNNPARGRVVGLVGRDGQWWLLLGWHPLTLRETVGVKEQIMVDARTVAAMLAEPTRRRVLGALLIAPDCQLTYPQLMAALVQAGVTEGPAVLKALDRLAANELVNLDVAPNLVVLNDHYFSKLGRTLKQELPDPGIEDPTGNEDRERQKVIRTFFREGRLTSVPMVRSKRLVVLDLLADRFIPGQLYSESRVNLILGQVHHDTAQLRRALVDEEFLGRRDGFYWRTGGTVTVEADPDAQ